MDEIDLQVWKLLVKWKTTKLGRMFFKFYLQDCVGILGERVSVNVLGQ